MDSEPGQWRVFGERTVYDNRWVRLGLADVETPDGRRIDYHVVHLAPVAIAMIVNQQNEVLMLWRHRFPVDTWGFELLGGLIEDGEEPVDAAAREALEESGWRPTGPAERLARFEPLPGQVTAPVEVILWRDAVHVGDPTDLEETGRIEWVPLERVRQLAVAGQLLGAGTLVAVLTYLAR